MAKNKKRTRMIRIPKAWNPPGKHTPVERLAYISPLERNLLERVSKGGSRKAPRGLLSYYMETDEGFQGGTTGIGTSSGGFSSPGAVTGSTGARGPTSPGGTPSRTGGNQPAGSPSTSGPSGSSPGSTSGGGGASNRGPTGPQGQSRGDSPIGGGGRSNISGPGGPSTPGGTGDRGPLGPQGQRTGFDPGGLTARSPGLLGGVQPGLSAPGRLLGATQPSAQARARQMETGYGETPPANTNLPGVARNPFDVTRPVGLPETDPYSIIDTRRALQSEFLTPEAQNMRLLNDIMKVEGTYNPEKMEWQDPYNQRFGFEKYPGPPEDLTNMTLAEVTDYQRNVLNPATGKINTSAVGAYQMQPGTIEDAAENLGMDLATTQFTPEVQDQLATEIARMQDVEASTWEGFGRFPQTLADARQAVEMGALNTNISPMAQSPGAFAAPGEVERPFTGVPKIQDRIPSIEPAGGIPKIQDRVPAGFDYNDYMSNLGVPGVPRGQIPEMSGRGVMPDFESPDYPDDMPVIGEADLDQIMGPYDPLSSIAAPQIPEYASTFPARPELQPGFISNFPVRPEFPGALPASDTIPAPPSTVATAEPYYDMVPTTYPGEWKIPAKYEVPDLPGVFPGRSRLSPIIEGPPEPLPEDIPQVAQGIPGLPGRGPIITGPEPVDLRGEAAIAEGYPVNPAEMDETSGQGYPAVREAVREVATVSPETDASPQVTDYVTQRYGPEMAQDIMRTVNIVKSAISGKKTDRERPGRIPYRRQRVIQNTNIPLLEA